MINLFSIYNDMVRDDIILSFKGDITQELLNAVYQIMETHLDTSQEELKRKKKFYHILVECLQNVYHHMEAMKNDNSSDDESGAIFIIARGPHNSYRILTGNHIRNTSIEDLQSKLEKINNMNAEELRTYYRESLSASEFSDKGGAGLGMIDIARKSGHKIEYHFQSINDNVSFFSLIVNIV